MSRGFSIAHSQVTPGLGSRSNELSESIRQPRDEVDSDSLNSIPHTQMLITGAESVLDGNISPDPGYSGTQSTEMRKVKRR